MRENSSVISNETAALQKLGFSNSDSNERVYASILNRLRVTHTVVIIVVSIFQSLHVLSIGFAVSIPGIFSSNSQLGVFRVILLAFLNPAQLASNLYNAHLIVLSIGTVFLIIWMIFYMQFVSHYGKTKSFHAFVINVTYYIGYHIFDLFHLVLASSVAYFLRPLINNDTSISSFLSFISLAIIFATIYIHKYLHQTIYSSPDVDVLNFMSLWPQNPFPGVYRTIISYILAISIEFLSNQKSINYSVPFIINIIGSCYGYYTIWSDDSFVFPAGKVFSSLQYLSIFLGSVLSLVFHYIGGNSLIFLVVFILIMVPSYFILSYISSKMVKTRIDLLYSKFENLIDNIDTPSKCMSLIKTGIIFNAPCITNHTLLSWANTRWPNEQPLLLLVSYIYYILHLPYREILDLVSIAVDIQPFSEHDGLLFYQIFNRLPTREAQLQRKIEGVKRLYQLPKSSLKHFWQAVLTHQWDEAVLCTRDFSEDLEKINQVFSNLIFQNPSSDSVMVEFIKFASEIQGNYAVAMAAQHELARRQVVEEDQPIGDGESQAQLSKLSSVKSSIFFSEFSEAGQGFDRVHNGIQSAFSARPVFWPFRFFILVLILAILSFSVIITVYIVVNTNSSKINHQLSLGLKLIQMDLCLAHMVETSLRFTSHSSTETLSGKPFVELEMRSLLNSLSNDFDTILSSSFSLYSYFSTDFLRKWVDIEVPSLLMVPDADGSEDVSESDNITLIASLRLFQLRARTLAFTPLSAVGNRTNPSAEVLQVTYLYPAVSKVVSLFINAIVSESTKDIKTNETIVYYTIIACLSLNFVIMIVSFPVVIFGYMKEFDFIVSIYHSIPTKIVRRLILSDSDKVAVDQGNVNENENNEQYEQSNRLQSHFYGTCNMFLIFFFVFLITPLPVLFIAYSYIHHISESETLIKSIELTTNVISNFGNIILFAFRLVTGFPSPYTESQEISLLNTSLLNVMEGYRTLFFGGTTSYPTGLGEAFPELVTGIGVSKCTVIIGEGQLNFSCMSFHESVFFIFDTVKRFVNYVTPPDSLNSTWWQSFYQAVDYSMLKGIDEFYEMYLTINNEDKTINQTFSIIALLAGILLFILATLVSYLYMRRSMNATLRGLLKPLMVMKPEFIGECPFLLRFLQGDFDNPSRQTNKEKGKKTGESSAPLIDYIFEGVLVLSADGTIIASNKKYHEMMANTAEEVLGLSIRSVMPPSLSSIFEALDTIKSGGSIQQNLSIETALFTEDDRELQVRISLVTQLANSERGSRSTMCALIIYDRSDLIRAQNLLRKEKQNVEELLDSILPHNIAVSLLNGQTEISFEVEKACILFSDLVSFTPMSSSMPAKQIMNTLNLLFTEFDTELAKYRRVTKLKTIGDAYVCAAGIFENDGPIEEAASEIVSFGLRMQEIVPMLNKKHNLQLHQRVGIHLGGPLICGVLGKEKPLFEVIGTTVTIAEDLESTSVHDKVHISQAVVDAVSSLGIKKTERGDGIKVPGLENQVTYTIG